uniref:DRBM domain-containing protein n=1 Tax=Macrostomum lignano TaxID=282301 RepID=A0A1I8FUH4_9PLAT
SHPDRQFRYEYQRISDTELRCNLLSHDGRQLGTGVGKNKRLARHMAALSGLETLAPNFDQFKDDLLKHPSLVGTGSAAAAASADKESGEIAGDQTSATSRCKNTGRPQQQQPPSPSSTAAASADSSDQPAEVPDDFKSIGSSDPRAVELLKRHKLPRMRCLLSDYMRRYCIEESELRIEYSTCAPATNNPASGRHHHHHHRPHQQHTCCLTLRGSQSGQCVGRSKAAAYDLAAQRLLAQAYPMAGSFYSILKLVGPLSHAAALAGQKNEFAEVQEQLKSSDRGTLKKGLLDMLRRKLRELGRNWTEYGPQFKGKFYDIPELLPRIEPHPDSALPTFSMDETARRRQQQNPDVPAEQQQSNQPARAGNQKSSFVQSVPFYLTDFHDRNYTDDDLIGDLEADLARYSEADQVERELADKRQQVQQAKQSWQQVQQAKQSWQQVQQAKQSWQQQKASTVSVERRRRVQQRQVSHAETRTAAKRLAEAYRLATLLHFLKVEMSREGEAKILEAAVSEELGCRHRPYFTLWITGVHVILFAVSLLMFGIVTPGINTVVHQDKIVKDRHNFKVKMCTIDYPNFLIGPATARPGQARGQSDMADCPEHLGTWLKWDNASRGTGWPTQWPRMRSGPSHLRSAAVASRRGVSVWADDVTRWPACQRQTPLAPVPGELNHLACPVSARPCCFGLIA